MVTAERVSELREKRLKVGFARVSAFMTSKTQVKEAGGSFVTKILTFDWPSIILFLSYWARTLGTKDYIHSD